MKTGMRDGCLILLAAWAFTGCSGGPPTQSVSGTITYKGVPVADAQVGFVPADGAADYKPARGQTDANGQYTLRTYVKPGQDVRGAMVGKFKVTVQKGLAQNEIVDYEDLQNNKSELPTRYADAKTTPLEAEVTDGGSNEFDFVLEDQPEG